MGNQGSLNLPAELDIQHREAKLFIKESDQAKFLEGFSAMPSQFNLRLVDASQAPRISRQPIRGRADSAWQKHPSRSFCLPALFRYGHVIGREEMKKVGSMGTLLPEGNGPKHSWQKDSGQFYRTCCNFHNKGPIYCNFHKKGLLFRGSKLCL